LEHVAQAFRPARTIEAGLVQPARFVGARLIAADPSMRSWPVRPSCLLPAVCLAAGLLAAGCESPTKPVLPAIVTFVVADETFRAQLTTEAQLDAARSARDGAGPQIPNGRIAAGTDVNSGWSWHLEDVEFVDATIELCDGRPSDVEREGTSYGGGRYCPWSAVVVAIDGPR